LAGKGGNRNRGGEENREGKKRQVPLTQMAVVDPVVHKKPKRKVKGETAGAKGE